MRGHFVPVFAISIPKACSSLNFIVTLTFVSFGSVEKSVIIGIARAGSDKPIVKADYLDALKSYKFGEIPHVLVVPGELHFLEKEALVKIAQAPEAI